MHVALLTSQPDESIVELAAAICVGKLDAPTEQGKNAAISSGHLSVLEHLNMSFLIQGVSRSLTHQLVRHRIASYSQESQRYAKVKVGEEWYVTPKTIAASHHVSEQYKRHMKDTASLYESMLQSGIPKEDARMILPNACHTAIVVSMNARSLIEQAEKRCCNKAQWEIKQLLQLMREAIKPMYPTVYNLAVPLCLKSSCPELKPCGKEVLCAT